MPGTAGWPGHVPPVLAGVKTGTPEPRGTGRLGVRETACLGQRESVAIRGEAYAGLHAGRTAAQAAVTTALMARLRTGLADGFGLGRAVVGSVAAGAVIAEPV